MMILRALRSPIVILIQTIDSLGSGSPGAATAVGSDVEIKVLRPVEAAAQQKAVTI